MGKLLRRLKDDVNKPLAAILTLNTIAHTIGAAGAGAQAAHVFGNAYVGLASAVLTLLILVFSEIIPKTLGAVYWRQLSSITARVLRYLIIGLYPFVKMSEALTKSLSHGPTRSGFSREEFAVMADLSSQEGHLAEQESTLLKNLLRFHDQPVTNAMTPRTVVFSISAEMTIEEYFSNHDKTPFTRIPLHKDQPENIIGFVLRGDLLLAKAHGKENERIQGFMRELLAVPENTTLPKALNELLKMRSHIMLIVSEYGDVAGIITLEDILETLLGLEIVDENDRSVDMQAVARLLWEKRAKGKGINVELPAEKSE
jgi:CBS domain containing-hemolysin-like protein